MVIYQKKYHSIAIFIILALIIYSFFVLKAYPSKIKNLFSTLKLSKNEHLKRHWNYYYQCLTFINDTVPENGLIIFPSEDKSPEKKFPEIFSTTLHNYFIFPRIAVLEDNEQIHSHKGPVYQVEIACADSRYNKKYLKAYRLDEDFSLLLLREGDKQIKSRLNNFSAIESTPLNMMLALIKLFLITASGLFIVAKYFEEKSLLGFFMTSFLVGTIISAITYILFSFAGINFIEELQFLFLGILSIPGVIIFIKKVRSTDAVKEIHFLSIITYTVIGLIFIAMFLKSVSTPIMVWNSCIWAAKAKSIFAFHNLNRLKIWSSFLYYPPLLPVLMSQVAVGGERMIKFIFPLFAICLYTNIYDELSETRYPLILKPILAVSIFIISQEFLTYSSIAYSNLALAVFATKAFTGLSNLLKSGMNKMWISVSIMLCGVMLIRPDGAAYFIYMSLLVCLWIYLKKYPFKNLLYLSIPLASILLWNLYCLFILKASPLPDELQVNNLKKFITGFNWLDFKITSSYIFKYTINPKSWGLIPAVFILLFLLRGPYLFKRYLPEVFYVLVGFVGLMLYSYYATTLMDIQLYFKTGFIRYLMPIIPVVFIMILKEIDLIVSKR